MIYEREKFAAPPPLISLVDQVARNIQPDEDSHLEWYREYVKHHRSRIAFDLQLTERFAKTGDQIGEFGPIPLLLTRSLQEKGFTVTGIDKSPDRFSQSIAEFGINLAHCDIETEVLPFADDHFDIIIFNELFEHLRINPIFTMHEVLRVLKPGGLLLLSSPNLRSYFGLKNLLLHNEAWSCSPGIYDEYEKLDILGHMGHVREYTTKELSTFLTRTGFAVERIIYRGRMGSRRVETLASVFPSLRPYASYVARKSILPDKHTATQTSH